VVTFISLDGTRLETGEVWCNGPDPKTLWCLLSDGTPVVVKGRTAKIPFPHQIEWAEIYPDEMDRWDYFRKHKHAQPLTGPEWRQALRVEKNMLPL
jgi:hypothetical protein